MPSKRRLLPVCGIVTMLAFVGLATAQGSQSGVEIELVPRLGIRFVAALIVGVLLGGGLLAFGPRYASETVADLREDPIAAFGWGLFAGIAVPIGLVLVALTVIGLLVTIPGLIALFVLGIVGEAVTIVWIGSFFSGSDGTYDAKTVLVGALALAVPGAIPLLGDFVLSVLGLFGLGVVSRRLYRSWRGDDRPRRSRAGQF